MLLVVLFLSASANQQFMFENIPKTHRVQKGLSQDTDSKVQILDAKGWSGEVVINENTGSSTFFWMWQKLGSSIENDTVPLMIFLTGGPGCSGENENLGQFGPIEIDLDLNPIKRNTTWSDLVHILFIDYPLDAGYSFAASSQDLVNTTSQATVHLYKFLSIITKKYPVWFRREVYIFGYSYAGHYIPDIAYKLLFDNHENLPIKLTKVAIGDPWVDPLSQADAYSEFSYAASLIDEHQRSEISQMEQNSKSQISVGNYLSANSIDSMIQERLDRYSGGVNLMNIRMYRDYNPGIHAKWLELNSTKALLHVPQHVEWVYCSDKVSHDFREDIMMSYRDYLEKVLEKVPVMIYGGQDDLLVSNVGVDAMIHSMSWYGQKYFQKAQRGVWKVQNSVAGYYKKAGNLVRVWVNKAGHLVPYDQPENAYDMVKRFINEEW